MIETCNDHIDHLSHCKYWPPVNMFNEVQKYTHILSTMSTSVIINTSINKQWKHFTADNLRRQYETVRESIPTPVGSGETSIVCKQNHISA